MNSRSLSFILAVLVLVSSFSFALTIIPENARATTLFVGGTGPGNHTTIQSAVNVAEPGDVVFVYSGTYYERVTIYTSLTLIGENKNTTIVDGGGTKSVISASADHVTIQRLTARNSGPHAGNSGIKIANAENCYVANNIVSENKYGIHLWYSNYTTITKNIALDNSIGIAVSLSHDNAIENNTVSRYEGAGISVIDYSPRILVANNTVHSGGYMGIHLRRSDNSIVTHNMASLNAHFGIHVIFSEKVTIDNNVAFSNNHSGFYFFCYNNSTIKNNIMSNNFGSGFGCHVCYNNMITENMAFHNEWHGLGLGDSFDNEIVGNSIGWNSLTGIFLGRSENNRVYHNNIMNNTQQGHDNRSANEWDDGYPSGGNHWSDYAGIDEKSGPSQNLPGSDGIGDTPYNIQGGSSRDRYPFMAPTTPIPTPPSAPRNLQAVAGNRQITLTWEPPSSDGGFPIKNFRIHRGNTSGGETFLVEIGNMLTYVDGGLIGGQTYYYRVSAVNAIGEGPLSNEASAIPITAPEAPETFHSILTGWEFENVTLTWSLSEDDGTGEESVVEYRIFRSVTYDSQGSGYGLIATVPNGTSDFVDSHTGEGDSNNYFYVLCAANLVGNISCAKDQAGKFTRPLYEGVNLVSIPLIQINGSVGKVLQTVRFDKAWSYDSLTAKWRWYVSFKPYKGELRTIDYRIGVWVDVTEDSNLTIAGIVPITTTIQLRAGWNLIGFPSFNSAYTVGDLKAVTGATRVEGFDSAAPPYFLQVLQNGDALQTGYGYWVTVNASVLWIVKNL